MTLYFAPLEGLTGGVYRRAHAAVFGGVDKYFTPFYSPSSIGLSKKEMAELDEDDRAITIPQLLTKRASDFLIAAAQLHALGYREINLNCGCPSGTVSAKHKGAGFLLCLDEMRAFFEELFDCLDGVAPGMCVSVKTRIGYGAENEFPEILDVYNTYPISQLTIHPRLRQDFYRGSLRLRAYHYAEQYAAMPLCYNGDVFSATNYSAFLEKVPKASCIMLGRGAVANPALFLELRGENVGDKRARLREMHDRILEENRRRMGDGKSLLCRMADLWNYQRFLFENGEEACRRIRRAANLAEYRAAVATLFRECPLLPNGAYCSPDL
ncbi:MAG: tRNA-dihydrouridine synthase family protein [Clostridia bacterium]|nr:tRNA-dihydrouridine synthase family protein [Clostridia bacterium]